MANPQHAKHPPLTEQQRQARLDDWLDMLAADHRLDEMGDKYGVSRQRVNQVLSKAGVSAHDVKTLARTTRVEALANTLIDCPSCGGQYLRKDYWQHYAKGTHRYLRNQDHRSTQDIARDAAIAADYDAGMTVSQMTAKYDVDPPHLYRALRWNGIEPSRRPSQRRRVRESSDQLKRWVIEAWQSETLLNTEIAERFGISPAWVGLILQEAGLRPSLSAAQHRRNRIMAKR